MTMPPIGDTRDLKSLIKEYIDQNKVMIFSKTTCSNCQKVKQLFQSLDVTYKSLELDTIENGAELQQSLLEMYGQTTVPNVFIGGQHVGGCDNTLKLHADDCLLPMIRGEVDELDLVAAAEEDAEFKQKQKEEQKALEEAKAKAADKDLKGHGTDDGFEVLGALPLDHLDTVLKEQNKTEEEGTNEGIGDDEVDGANGGFNLNLTQSPDDPSKATESQQEEYRTELVQVDKDIKKMARKIAIKRTRQEFLKSSLGIQQDSDATCNFLTDAKKIKLAPDTIAKQDEDRKPSLKLLYNTLALISSTRDENNPISALQVQLGFGKGILAIVKDDSVLEDLKKAERSSVVEKGGKELTVTDVHQTVQLGIDNAPHIIVFQGAEFFSNPVTKCLIQYVTSIRMNCGSVLIVCLGKDSTESVKKLEEEFVLLTE